jgi:hypothetical protein
MTQFHEFKSANSASTADLLSFLEVSVEFGPSSRGVPFVIIQRRMHPNATEPYAPCPCNSGRKYKFCCRAKGR